MAQKVQEVTDHDIDEALGSSGEDNGTAGGHSGQAEVNLSPPEPIQDSVGAPPASGRELARRPGDLVGGQIRIASKAELTELAKALHASGRTLGEAKDLAGLYLALLAGTEAGLTVSQSIKNVAVIRGNATIWGDAFTALVLAHPEYAGHKVSWSGEGDKLVCTVTAKRAKRLWNNDAAHVEHTEEFGVNDAKAMSLWGKSGPWKSAPRRMLRHRCVGYAFRELFADVLGGLSIREEVQDFDPSQMKHTGSELPADIREQVKAKQEGGA